MKKLIAPILILAFCAPVLAQDQQPVPEQDQPQQFPPQFQPQYVPQNGEGETNGISREAVGELLQEVMRLREERDAAKPEDAKPDESPAIRRIRGEGTRGTTGSGTNAVPLASLLNHSGANRTNGTGIRLNFRNASLSLVLDYLSEAAGLVVSANSKVDLQGKVTVWSNQLVDRTEAIRLLNLELSKNGYGATVEGNLLNIYVVDPTNTPIAVGVENNDYTKIPPTKDLVTQIVYVSNVEANQLISSLQPLMPAGTSMSANQGANAIVVTDTKANIRRMVQLVKALDTGSASALKLEVFPLDHADATALAQVVQQIFTQDSSSSRSRSSGFGGGGFPDFREMFRGGGDRGRDGSSSSAARMSSAKVTAVADERSNSLVVSASEEQMAAVSNIVKQMDVDVQDVAELRVFKLRHADPQETADQLATLFPDPTQQNSSSRSSRGFGFFSGFGDRGRSDRGSSSASATSRKVQQARVSAVPDPRTSSVIVSASRDLMPDIEKIIWELDSDSSKKKKVYVIDVQNRDPAELVEELQSVISTDSSGGNLNNNRTSQQNSALRSRQQNNLQNQNNNNNSGVMGNSFGNSGGNRTSGR